MKSKKKNTNCIWVLVYTKANEEKRANENLKKQGFKTFLPLILPSNKNSKFVSPVPVFPRYLFVEINPSLGNWPLIKSSYGVSNLVMFSDEFTSIPFEIIEAMQHRLDATGVYKEDFSIVDFQKGDNVSIESGRFAGIEAIFLSKKSKDRVTLLLKLLSTTVLAEIDESDLGKKEVIKNFKF
tara:strand:- start:174 stop:719 length:546 start_codon:yes stop_codon:yes gene_type:complete